MLHTDSICSLWMRSDLNFCSILKKSRSKTQVNHILICLNFRLSFFLQYGSSFTIKKKKNMGCELTRHFFLQTVTQRAFQCYTFYKLLIQTSKILKTYGYAWNALKRGTMFLSVTYINFLSFSMKEWFMSLNFLGLKYLNYNEVYNLSTQNCNGIPTYCSATSLALVYELVLYLILL